MWDKLRVTFKESIRRIRNSRELTAFAAFAAGANQCFMTSAVIRNITLGRVVFFL